MNAADIRKWRPTSFNDFIGAANLRKIARLQRTLRRGRLPSPLLLVGVYGYGKTSLARLLMKSLDCESRNTATSDPCNKCSQCQCFGKHYNGFGHPYRRFEYDCTQMSRRDLVGVLGEDFFESKIAIFMDEIHHLHEKLSQEPMLKFVEDFDGILVAAIMEDRLDELIPPLRERFDMLTLTPPTADEMVEFFMRKKEEWHVHYDETLIRSVVQHSGQSFRISQRIIAAASEEEDRKLTEELVIDMLALDV